VIGTEGRASAWDNGQFFRTWRPARSARGASLDPPGEARTHTPSGGSATVATIRSLIRELEMGERTSGNIDVTMQSVEVQFGLVASHFQGGSRVALPIADRSVSIPGR
jgi:hypothetical protein